MAYSVRNLSVLNYAQGFTLWHYKELASPIAEVIAGIENDALMQTDGIIQLGDMLMISAFDGGAMRYVTSDETNNFTLTSLV